MSKFTEFDAKKLYKLYKHAVRKKEKDVKKEKAKVKKEKADREEKEVI